MLNRQHDPSWYTDGNDDQTFDTDPVPSFDTLRLDSNTQATSFGTPKPSSTIQAQCHLSYNGKEREIYEAERQSSHCTMRNCHSDRAGLSNGHFNAEKATCIDKDPAPAFDALKMDHSSPFASDKARGLSFPSSSYNFNRKELYDAEIENSNFPGLNCHSDQDELLYTKGNGDKVIESDPIGHLDTLGIDGPGTLESSMSIDDEKNPTQHTETQSTVVLLGKLGHGKTRMVNMICGETFDSNMGNGSCTRSMQVARSLHRGISIIDTPGFYSCRDTSEHISQQKSALEGEQLNGIYAVVKFGRIDEMVEILNQIMDFCGDDDIRILITHMDIAASEQGFDFEETRELLSESLDVDAGNIGFVGKAVSNDEILTTPEELEDFVSSTLHEPRSFKVSIEQSAYMSARSPGARQFESQLGDIYKGIETAEAVCKLVSELSDSSTSTYYLDQVKTTAILAVQDCVQKVAADARFSIQRKSAGLAASELNVLHANVNVKLKLGVDRFISKTDSLLAPRYSHSYLYSGQRRRHWNQLSDRLTAQFISDDKDCEESLVWLVKRRDGDSQTVLLADLPKLVSELQLPSQATKKGAKKKAQRPLCGYEESTKGSGFEVHKQKQHPRASSSKDSPLKFAKLSDCIPTDRLSKSDLSTTMALSRPTSKDKKEPSGRAAHGRSKYDEANSNRSAVAGASLSCDGDSANLSYLGQTYSDKVQRATTWTDNKETAHTVNKDQNPNSEVDQQNAADELSHEYSYGDGNRKKHALEQDGSVEEPMRRKKGSDHPLLWYVCFLCCTSFIAYCAGIYAQ